MGIMDLVNVNYKQIFNSLMQSSEAQSMMADFINHCLLHCDETRQCVIDVLSKDDKFNSVVDEAIERIIKKNTIKNEYFNS